MNQHVKKSAVAKLATAEQQPTPRFTSNTAASTGKSERVIQRSIQRVEELGEDNAKAIMGTSLAKGVEMDALIKLPEPERKVLIERAVTGPQV